MGDVIIEGCPLCKGNGKPYQQTHTQCFDGSLLISTGCSKCGLNILGKGDDSRQKWNSIDRPKHLEQRLAEVEVKKTDLILLAKAAKDYINKSPCDPDIFPEQWEAYVVYKQLLEKTNEV